MFTSIILTTALACFALWSIYSASPPYIVATALAVGCWLTFPAALPATAVSNPPAVKTLAVGQACNLSRSPSQGILANAETESNASKDEDVFPHLTASFQTLSISSGGCLESKSKSKKVKRVVIAEDKNMYKEVENWIVPWRDQHDCSKSMSRHAHWDVYDAVYEFEPYLHDEGAQSQLHFPRTKFIRNVPDVEFEDSDGDIAMSDA